jgi:hypothetical protein
VDHLSNHASGIAELTQLPTKTKRRLSNAVINGHPSLWQFLHLRSVKQCVSCTGIREGPATHLCLVLFVSRSYEKKPENAGPPGRMLSTVASEEQLKCCGFVSDI